MTMFTIILTAIWIWYFPEATATIITSINNKYQQIADYIEEDAVTGRNKEY